MSFFQSQLSARFGDALHRVFPEVQQLEDWAKNLLGELAQKASQATPKGPKP